MPAERYLITTDNNSIPKWSYLKNKNDNKKQQQKKQQKQHTWDSAVHPQPNSPPF
jgi:hypothetical protein